jgi:hypothetical protein
MPIGELYALLTLHAKQYEDGLVKAEAQAKGFSGGAAGAFAGVAKAVALAGVAVTGVAVGIGIKGLEMADVLDRAKAIVVAAYGKTAGAVEDWAHKNQVALGVTETDLDKSLSAWGVYAKGIGLNTSQAASFGEGLSQRAAQIAADTGQSYDEVFSALEKGVQGATRGLKTYGVAIDPVVLRNEALAMGLIHGKEKLDLHSKALATEALILQQTTPYVKAFGTAHDSVGFQMKDIGVIIDETMISIGQAVAPIAAVVMPALLNGVQAVSGWIVANLPTIEAIFGKVFGAIGTAVSWVGGVVTAFVTAAMPILTDAFNTLVDKVLPGVEAAFNWIASNVIPAIGAAFDWVTQNVLPPLNDAFKFLADNFDVIGPAIAAVVAAVIIPAFVAWGVAALTTAAGVVIALAPIIAVIGVVALVFKALQMTWEIYGDKIKAGIGVVAKFIGTAFDNLKLGIKTAWDFIVNVVTTAINVITAPIKIFQTLVSGLFDVVPNAIKTVINAVIGVVNGVIDAVDSVKLSVHVGPVNWDWAGIGIPNFHYLETGTPSFSGGWAILGEKGPELARLPGGTSVYPAGQSKSMLGGGGATITQYITGFTTDEVTQQVQLALKRDALSKGLAGGLA